MSDVAVDNAAARGTPGSAALWIGRGMSGLAGAFLLLDAVMKFVQPEPVVKATTELGYSASVILPLGIILLASTLLYLFPRTAVVGAILLTGYLGGAIATHVRVGNPLWTHILMPVYIAVLLWGGLCLRDKRIATTLFH